MSKMKLGTKIVLGFSLLLIITLVLGLMAVYQMYNGKNSTDRMANEYVPEVGLANEMERAVHIAVRELRQYTASEDAATLEKGRKYVAEFYKFLGQARDHAAKYPQLVKLKEDTVKLEAKYKEWLPLIDETEKKIQAVQEARKVLDQAGTEFVQNTDSFQSNQVENTYKEIAAGAAPDKIAERLKKIDMAADWLNRGSEVRIAAQKAQARREPQLIKEALPLFDKMNKTAADIRALTREEVNIRQIENALTAQNRYKGAMESLFKSWLELQEVAKKRLDVADALLKYCEETAEAGMGDTSKLAQNAASNMSLANTVMTIGLIAALIIGIGAAILISRSITKPIILALAGLNEGSDQVTSAANQVSSASQELAEGSSEQAAAVEETSASLEEMTSMTRRNADNAGQANILMDQAKATVSRAGSSMKEMTTAMAEIASSGQEISKIIKTIDEIAFQTNLLALNAAVEAARAGEAGAGFAVVADEVRNLAQRAAEAAKNTASLIEGTVGQINKGTNLVRTADEAFTEVSVSAAKVAELVSDISSASNEQAQGIDQINQAVTQMDKVTQKNAANAEETASAAEELNAQSESMRDIVNELAVMVGGDRAGTAVSARRPAARPARALAAPKVTMAQVPAKIKPKSGGNAPPAKAKVAKADEIIPMDDDFKDF